MRSDQFWQWFETEARPKLGNRGKGFSKIFEYLDRLDRPVGIVETGCTRRGDTEDDWLGDGCATLLFDRYAQTHPGSIVDTVDIDSQATANCQALVSNCVRVHTEDSVKFLERIAAQADRAPLDLLYLDSYDLDYANWTRSALHHLNELMAAMPIIRRDTLVVNDDALPLYNDFPPRYEIGGKGAFVAYHARHVGADLLFAEYQVGWVNIAPYVSKNIETIADLVHRARSYMEDQPIKAEALYRRVLEITTPPKGGLERLAHGEACVYYAHAAVLAKRYGTALDWYRQALQVDPLAVDYRLEYALNVLAPLNMHKQAKIEAESATQIEPDNPSTWRYLANFEQHCENIDGCIAALDRQLKLAPDSADALLDRCAIAIDVEDHAFARKLITKVLETDRKGDALHALGMIAYREGRHEDAVDLYNQALHHGVQQPGRLHWNECLALQSIGYLHEAWSLYKYRKGFNDNAVSLPVIRFVKPMWEGEMPPARLHVHTEAGAGDNILLMRYLPMLVEEGFDVRYETVVSMVDFVKYNFPAVDVVPIAPDYPGSVGLKDFDYHIPIGNLPMVFGTGIDTIPECKLLKADPVLVAEYRRKIPAGSVGLCWSSGIRPGIWLSRYGRYKSMHFDELAMITVLPRSFISLQVGPERSQQKAIVDVLPSDPTWMETAAVIACLDLVITVDTAVAHLAASMGKPVYLMLQSDSPSLHWMAERPGAPWNERSPWYPSVRIYRQRKPHEWHSVVQRIAHDLGRKVDLAA